MPHFVVDFFCVCGILDKIMIGDSICKLCGLETYVNLHHLIPRSKGGTETIPCCPTCESYLHRTWNNGELRNIYNTVKSILQTEKFKSFLKWRLKQPSTVLFKSQPGKFRDRNKYH